MSDSTNADALLKEIERQLSRIGGGPDILEMVANKLGDERPGYPSEAGYLTPGCDGIDRYWRVPCA